MQHACPVSVREEIAWAAGFFDAEGSFSFTDPGRFAMISIGQVVRDPLDRFRDALGVGTVRGPFSMRSSIRPSKKPQFRYYAYGSRALIAARLLWPYLSTLKRSRIRTAVDRVGVLNPKLNATPVVFHEHSLTRREQLAWAAGFFEGDGSFSKGSGTIVASITQRDRGVLDRFEDVMGLGTVYGPYRHRTPTLSSKAFHLYRAHGLESTQAVAAYVWFKLGDGKRHQAAQVLRSWPKTCHRGHPKRSRHPGCGECQRQFWRRYREEPRQTHHS